MNAAGEAREHQVLGMQAQAAALTRVEIVGREADRA